MSESSKKKQVAKKQVVKKSATRKKVVTKRATVKKTPVKKSITKKPASKKNPVKKTIVKKSAAKKTPVKKSIAKKSLPKKSIVKKTAAKKAPVKKSSIAAKLKKQSTSKSVKDDGISAVFASVLKQNIDNKTELVKQPQLKSESPVQEAIEETKSEAPVQPASITTASVTNISDKDNAEKAADAKKQQDNNDCAKLTAAFKNNPNEYLKNLQDSPWMTEAKQNLQEVNDILSNDKTSSSSYVSQSDKKTVPIEDALPDSFDSTSKHTGWKRETASDLVNIFAKLGQSPNTDTPVENQTVKNQSKGVFIAPSQIPESEINENLVSETVPQSQFADELQETPFEDAAQISPPDEIRPLADEQQPDIEIIEVSELEVVKPDEAEIVEVSQLQSAAEVVRETAVKETISNPASSIEANKAQKDSLWQESADEPEVENKIENSVEITASDNIVPKTDEKDSQAAKDNIIEDDILNAQIEFLNSKDNPRVNCSVRTVSQKVHLKDVVSLKVFYDQAEHQVEEVEPLTEQPETNNLVNEAADDLESTDYDANDLDINELHFVDVTDSPAEQVVSVDDINKPKESESVETETPNEETEEKNSTLDFQAALDAVNLKQPAKSKPNIDLDSIRSDINKVHAGTGDSSSVQVEQEIDETSVEEAEKKSAAWHKMVYAYIKDKKDKLTSVSEKPEKVEKEITYQEVEVEGLFGGVWHAVGNGAKNIASVGKYTKLGITEGAKDTKNLVSSTINKIKS